MAEHVSSNKLTILLHTHSVIFILYDLFVSRRQQFVMNRALASGAIVSSLFPSTVRDQLYEENHEKLRQADSKGKPATKEAWSAANEPGLAKNSPRPIAQQYDNTTVLFADLVGFTNWSSTRTPAEVFALLENLYGAFGKLLVLCTHGRFFIEKRSHVKGECSLFQFSILLSNAFFGLQTR